jgi:hypothetical protein
MKLRIYRNSLRFRLGPADVARFNAEGTVVEKMRFGPEAEFSYLLRTEPNVNAIRATLTARAICVEIPINLVRQWSEGKAVGLHHVQQVGSGKTLDILIEKDFECLEGKMNEPGEAFYPNPNKACLANDSSC